MPASQSRRALLAMPAILGLARAAHAEDWRPTQTVRVVVPTAAAGTTDVMARLLGPALTSRWGQPVVVDNRPGAGGIIGTMEVVRAAPDGHTFLMGNLGAQSILYALARNLPYKPEDLIPIANMIDGPGVLVVNPSMRVNTVAEFAALLRANPDRYSYGTPGIGSSPHLAGVWFGQLTGTRSTAVHYRGAGPAQADLFAGNIAYIFDALVNEVEAIRSGRVRALAVTGTERWPLLPEIPTVRESLPELAGFSYGSWVGLFAPRNTPEAIARSANAGAQRLLETEDARARFLGMGGLPRPGTPADFAAFVRAETAKWGEVIRREGLQVDLS